MGSEKRMVIGKPTCKSCPFFAILEKECRAHSPQSTLIPVQGPMGQASFSPTAYWPPAREGQWCGEHPDMKNAKSVLDVDGN